MPAAAAPGVFNYTSKINNSTYMLNTNPMANQGAESFCNDYGGHLVSYGSAAEQVGALLPGHGCVEMSYVACMHT
jgi:hypothetical protein